LPWIGLALYQRVTNDRTATDMAGKRTIGRSGPGGKGEFLLPRRGRQASVPTTMKISACLLCAAMAVLIGCASTPQKKYSKASTSELRLKHSQLVEALGPDVRSSEFSYHPPGLAGLAFSNPKEERIKEKQEIEVELLRRYQGGDQSAHLAIFDK
jgi:hypothetical protein